MGISGEALKQMVLDGVPADAEVFDFKIYPCVILNQRNDALNQSQKHQLRFMVQPKEMDLLESDWSQDNLSPN